MGDGGEPSEDDAGDDEDDSGNDGGEESEDDAGDDEDDSGNDGGEETFFLLSRTREEVHLLKALPRHFHCMSLHSSHAAGIGMSFFTVEKWSQTGSADRANSKSSFASFRRRAHVH